MQANKKKNLPRLLKSDIITGDILFVSDMSNNLSIAIDKVTQTTHSTHFTHMGIAEKLSDKLKVYHAKPKFGVVQESLQGFLNSPNNFSLLLIVYRLKPGLQTTILPALKRAKSLLGQPYDDTYMHNNPGFYCSNYVQQIFESDAIFHLEPMTFKNPRTNKFLETWVQHYERLGIPIPEGELGCNPNGMATSNYILPVGYFY